MGRRPEDAIAALRSPPMHARTTQRAPSRLGARDTRCPKESGPARRGPGAARRCRPHESPRLRRREHAAARAPGTVRAPFRPGPRTATTSQGPVAERVGPAPPRVPSADRRGRLTTSVPDGRRFEREPAKHAVRASQESTWRLSCVRTQKPSIAGVVAWADVLVPLHEHPAPQSTASGSPCMSIHRPARRRLQVSGSPTPSRAEGAGASPRWRRGNSCLPERRANER